MDAAQMMLSYFSFDLFHAATVGNTCPALPLNALPWVCRLTLSTRSAPRLRPVKPRTIPPCHHHRVVITLQVSSPQAYWKAWRWYMGSHGWSKCSFTVSNSCLELPAGRISRGALFCGHSPVESEVKTKLCCPHTGEKGGYCALRCFLLMHLNAAVIHLLLYIFTRQMSACKLHNFGWTWKKVKTSTEVCKTGCGCPKMHDFRARVQASTSQQHIRKIPRSTAKQRSLCAHWTVARYRISSRTKEKTDRDS